MDSASSGQRSLALVIVDTSQHLLAAQALAHTMRQLQRAALVPAQLLIYSDRADTWGGLQVRPIEPLRSIGAYNRLVLHRLARELVASHALVIQYDGFVLDGAEFSPHFWHYDYIGAPWPHLPDSPVGNGGFSWRSRQLVQAVAALPYEDEREAEDLFICRRCRPLLEQQGLRFAPPALAAHFSVESMPVPHPTFGFHGVFHLPQVYRHNLPWLLQQLPDATLHKWAPHLRARTAPLGEAALALLDARLAEPQAAVAA